MKNFILFKRIFFIVILIFILTSCGKNQKVEYDSFENNNITQDVTGTKDISYDESKTAELDAITDQTLAPPPPSPPSGETSEISTGIEIEQKIIKTATISFELKDYDKNKVQIDAVVAKFNGNISEEQEYRNEWNITNTIKIRVPNENFDTLVNNLLLLASKVDSKIITVEDVTEQYIDVATRLKTKKEVEQQYLEILKKAYTINDILSVNNYLRIIREEIEAQEGKLKFMDNQVSLSTINLSIYENFTPTEVRTNSFWKKIGEAFKNGWNGFLVFIIGIFRIWPVWLILGIVIFLIVRKIRKSKIKKQSLQS